MAESSTLRSHALNLQYDALPSDSIRLLKILAGSEDDQITCMLVTAPINTSAGAFIALSYVWGPEPQEYSHILVNDASLPVRPDLYQTLQALRQPNQTEVYWIDAICINQQNQQEKSRQIPLMAEIYSMASYVLVWLGKSAEDSDYVMDCIHRRGTESFKLPRFQFGLGRILQRRWFKRSWVLQEFALNRADPIIACGDAQRVTWSQFEQSYPEEFLTETVQHDIKALKLLASLYDADAQAAYYFLRKVRLNFRSDGPEQPLRFIEYNLRTAIHAAMRCQATDPRDKIYGVLGMVKSEVRNNMVVDYNKSEADVFQDAMEYLLVNEQDPLIYARFPILPSTQRHNPSMPSWVLDFNPEIKDASPYLKFFDLPEDSHPTFWSIGIRGPQLSVQGLFVGYVDHLLEANFPYMERYKDEDLSASQANPGMADGLLSCLSGMQEYANLLGYLSELDITVKARLDSDEQFSLVEPLWKTLVLAKSTNPQFENTLENHLKWTSLLEMARTFVKIPKAHLSECVESITSNKELIDDLFSQISSFANNAVTPEALESANRASEMIGHVISHSEVVQQYQKCMEVWHNCETLSTSLRLVLCSQHCFFLGSHGCYGVGSPGLQKGDHLVLLFPDFYMPFILRETEGAYKMVGLAYIPPQLRNHEILVQKEASKEYIII